MSPDDPDDEPDPIAKPIPQFVEVYMEKGSLARSWAENNSKHFTRTNDITNGM
jgi:hypothetical protein